MPTRTESHVIGDKALAQVMAIVASCDFAGEVVHNDYGEDLLVQTKVGTRVDPHRLWIQVKGTKDLSRFTTKKHGLHLKISEDHAFRWVRSPDTVVVVLWDVMSNKGWWSMPSSSLVEWDFRIASRTPIRLNFDFKSTFDEKALARIAWLSRIDHYETLIARALAMHGQHKDRAKGVILLACYDLLTLLGIVTPDGVDSEIIGQVTNAEARGMPLGEGCVLAILKRTADLFNGGVTTQCLTFSAELLYEVFSFKHIDHRTGKLVANGFSECVSSERSR